LTINISAKNVELNEDLKSYVKEKVLKYEGQILEPAVCDILLSDEFGPRGGEDKLVRITMSLPNEKNTIHVEAQTSDFFGSIDLVEGKLAREIEKYKEIKKIGPRNEKELE
jgi:ribosomal subunit interface protein